jgi:hypothetical protein
VRLTLLFAAHKNNQSRDSAVLKKTLAARSNWKTSSSIWRLRTNDQAQVKRKSPWRGNLPPLGAEPPKIVAQNNQEGLSNESAGPWFFRQRHGMSIVN